MQFNYEYFGIPLLAWSLKGFMNFDIALADNNKTLPLINRNDSLLPGLVVVTYKGSVRHNSLRRCWLVSWPRRKMNQIYQNLPQINPNELTVCSCCQTLGTAAPWWTFYFFHCLSLSLKWTLFWLSVWEVRSIIEWEYANHLARANWEFLPKGVF